MAPLFAPRLLALAAAHAAAAAPLDTALVFESVRSQCHSLLTQTMMAGHSSFELSALCRARAPPGVCRAALKALGPTPWTPAAMHTACDAVQSQWRRHFLSVADPRALEDGSDESSAIQLELDEVMRKKHELGVCPDKALDECAKFKAAQYPEKAKDLEAVLDKKYKYAKDTGVLDAAAKQAGAGEAGAGVVLPPPDQSESKFEALPGIFQSGGDSSAGFWLGFAAGATVAMMFVVFIVVRRSRQCMNQGNLGQGLGDGSAM